MSSASLTSTDAVKHSNYHGSDRGGATTTNTQHYGRQHTHMCTQMHANRNTPTHVLTLTAFLTSAHRQARKTYNKKSEIILQSKGEKTRQTVASVNDRGG